MDRLTDITYNANSIHRIVYISSYTYIYIRIYSSIGIPRAIDASIRASKLKSNETRSFDESNLDHRSIK